MSEFVIHLPPQHIINTCLIRCLMMHSGPLCLHGSGATESEWESLWEKGGMGRSMHFRVSVQ